MPLMAWVLVAPFPQHKQLNSSSPAVQHHNVLWSAVVGRELRAAVQNAILENVASIGSILSPDSRHVLTLVEESPAAAAPIMVHFLGGVLSQSDGIPPPPLVDAAMQHYVRSLDVEVLALIIPGMRPQQALDYSGQLMKMPLDKFKAAVRKLVQRADGSAGVVKPRELLIHFHLIDGPKLNVCLWLTLHICTSLAVGLATLSKQRARRQQLTPVMCMPHRFPVGRHAHVGSTSRHRCLGWGRCECPDVSTSSNVAATLQAQIARILGHHCRG
jgi:hypothetical protein